MFEGLSVAIVTPMSEGALDLPAVDRVVEHLLAGGVQGIVACGSTGEGATLTDEERDLLLARVVERARGRAWVVAGTGTNDTARTIHLTRRAAELGADGALVVAPYYNKPTPEGLVAHFEAVAGAGGLPILVYNIPGRTAVNMAPETLVRLAEHPRIVAVKESSGSPEQTLEICRASRLTVLAGDDALTLPLLAVGARGLVSVLGHLAPAALRSMIDAFLAGRIEEARRIAFALQPLARALFLETNPAPVKHALARFGLIREELRLPLVPIRPATAEQIDAILASTPEAVAPSVNARAGR